MLHREVKALVWLIMYCKSIQLVAAEIENNSAVSTLECGKYKKT